MELEEKLAICEERNSELKNELRDLRQKLKDVESVVIVDNPRIRCGDMVTCKYTGFRGTVMQRCDELGGRIQVQVRGRDEGYIREEWLKEDNVKLYKTAQQVRQSMSVVKSDEDSIWPQKD